MDYERVEGRKNVCREERVWVCVGGRMGRARGNMGPGPGQKKAMRSTSREGSSVAGRAFQPRRVVRCWDGRWVE